MAIQQWVLEWIANIRFELLFIYRLAEKPTFGELLCYSALSTAFR